MRKLYPLTDQEREFAEANISLVDKFLSCKGFHPDDYYDIAVFGYLEAIQVYFRKLCESERHDFNTLAFINMRYAISAEWKKKRLKKRCAQVVSIDYAVNPTNGNEYSLNDYIPDTTQNVELQVENRDLIGRTLNVATPREQEAIGLTYKGLKNYEIAKTMGIAAETARAHLCYFRKKARNIRDEIPITCRPQYEKRKKYFLAYPEALDKHKAYQREYQRQHHAANRERLNAYNRAWRARQKEKALLELQPQQGTLENLSVAL